MSGISKRLARACAERLLDVAIWMVNHRWPAWAINSVNRIRRALENAIGL